MKKSKKKVFTIIVIVFAVIIVIGGVLLLIVTDGLKEGLNVPLDGIDLSEIADGVYTGTYEHKRWTNTVRVYVSNNMITKIEIVNDVGAVDVLSISNEVFDRVINAQNTDIDAVTGATVTSRAYLKAIENALTIED